jgi:hypothetical protein
MLDVIKKLPGYQPLCYIKGGLILARRKKLYKCNLNLGDLEYLCELPRTFKEKYFSRSRLLSRIFRLQVRCALNVRDEFVFLVCRDQVWRLNLDTYSVTLDFEVPGNRTALYLTFIKGNNHSDDKVVFGEYFSNPDKVPVNIWATAVNAKSNWQVVYKFESNEINHVHNILYNDISDECYILTGDFGNAAAFFRTNSEFECVTPYMRGKQKYRACWGIIDNNGITYATDTQLESNSLCQLIDKKVLSSEQIEGSSIYFGKNNVGHFFSTTVEPDEPSGNFIRDVFSYKLGNGILSTNSKIYSLDNDKNINVEFIGKKDILPTRLGQFGSFTFPSGTFDGKGIITYGIALGRYDGCCLLLGEKQ